MISIFHGDGVYLCGVELRFHGLLTGKYKELIVKFSIRVASNVLSMYTADFIFI